MPRNTVCTICNHPNRKQIEDSIRRREPIDRIARLHALSATAVRRHRDGDHEVKRPIPVKRRNPTPWPTDDDIRGMNQKQERTRLLVRYFAERRWEGGKTVAYLACLWRSYFGYSAETIVAELAGEAATTHAKLRGTREFRREEMIVRYKRIADKAERAEDFAAAISAMKQECELDGLTHDPGMVTALLEAQAFRAIVRPLIEREAPHLIGKIEQAALAAEKGRQRAMRTIEQGPNPEDIGVVEPKLPPHEERAAEKTDDPKGFEDAFGERWAIEKQGKNEAETSSGPSSPTTNETFAAPRNLGGRRPRATPEKGAT